MDRVTDLVCEHCRTVFPDITALRRHTIAYKQAAKKGITFEEHIKEQRRKRKRLMQGSPENSSPGELVCRYCELSFSTAGRLGRHNISHKDLHVKMIDHQPPAKIEQPKKIEERPKSETPQTPKICDECGKKFDQNSTLQRHLRYHTRMRRQTCAKCGVLFRSVPYLVAHMAQEHGVFNSARRDVFRSDTTINVKCYSVHGEQALYHIPPDSHEIPPRVIPGKEGEKREESLLPLQPRVKGPSGTTHPGLVSVLSTSALTECFLSMLSRNRIGQGTAKLCGETADVKSPSNDDREPVGEAMQVTSEKEEPVSPLSTTPSSSSPSLECLMTPSIPKHLLRLRILSRLNETSLNYSPIHGNLLSYKNSYPRTVNRQPRPFPVRLLESMTNETVANLIAATSLLQIRNFVLILIQQEMRLLDELSLVMLLYQHMHALLKLIEEI